MCGPVLYLELLHTARRSRFFLFRWLYGGWLLLQFGFFYFQYWFQIGFVPSVSPYAHADPNVTSRFAIYVLGVVAAQQFLIILLLTPAFTAAAITEEKVRGTLANLLLSHLKPGEIILTKLLARLARIGVLLLPGLPIICFVGVFGGLHPLLLFVLLVSWLPPLVGLGSAGVLASVLCRTTRDAVIAVYAVMLGSCLVMGGIHNTAGSLGDWTTAVSFLWTSLSPMELLQSASESENTSEVGQRLAWYCLLWGGMATVCLLTAVWRLPAAPMQTDSPKKDRKRRQRHVLDRDPIVWKEQEIHGITPLRLLSNIPRWLGMALVGLATAAICMGFLHIKAREEQNFLLLAQSVLVFSSLVAGVRCSGTVSGERERGTWEPLLLTPLATRQLIRGKVRGVLGASLPYLAAYGVSALILAACGGMLAFFWVALLLMLTPLVMYYLGAAGIYCSVRCQNSWRSLIFTLGLGYLGAFLIYLPASCVAIVVAAVVFIFLRLMNEMYNLAWAKGLGGLGDWWVAYFIASWLTVGLVFFFVARFFLADAENQVANRERTRHWEDKPRPRRRIPARMAASRR